MRRRNTPRSSTPHRLGASVLVAVLFVVTLNSCGDIGKPAIGDARAKLEEHLASASIGALRGGAFKLLAFEKVVGHDAELFGVKTYTIVCRATLEHLTSYRARKNNPLGPLYQRTSFRKGDRCIVNITVGFTKSDEGWVCSGLQCGDVEEIPGPKAATVPSVTGSWSGTMPNPLADMMSDRSPAPSLMKITQTGTALHVLHVRTTKRGGVERLEEQEFSGTVDIDGEVHLGPSVAGLSPLGIAFLSESGTELSEDPNEPGRFIRMQRSESPSAMERQYDEAVKRRSEVALDGEWFVFCNYTQDCIPGKPISAVTLTRTTRGAAGPGCELEWNVDRLYVRMQTGHSFRDALQVSTDILGDPQLVANLADRGETTFWRPRSSKAGAVKAVAELDVALNLLKERRFADASQQLQELHRANAENRLGFFIAYRLAQARCGEGDTVRAVDALCAAFAQSFRTLTPREQEWFVDQVIPVKSNDGFDIRVRIGDPKLASILEDEASTKRLSAAVRR